MVQAGGSARKLCAYVGEDEMYEDKPLWQALVEQSRTQGCAGATVTRGLSGFGATSREVEKHGLRMSSDRPVIVTVVDENVKITALGEVWDAMIPSGLLTIEDVCVIAYRAEHS